jgi:hypothetical protein
MYIIIIITKYPNIASGASPIWSANRAPERKILLKKGFDNK